MIIKYSISLLLLALSGSSSFSTVPSLVTHSYHAGPLFSTIAPPTDTEETYGTIVGDTKGAALRLSDVAISRGASSLLKNIEWSVQPNERWGIVGVNGAGCYYWYGSDGSRASSSTQQRPRRISETIC